MTEENKTENKEEVSSDEFVPYFLESPLNTIRDAQREQFQQLPIPSFLRKEMYDANGYKF